LSASAEAARAGKLLVARACVLLACLGFAGGCREELNTVYGRRLGAGATSVNGTAVLGEMMAQRGHTVLSSGRLSPKLRDRADVIVWFPDDFRVPSEPVRNWLEEWLLDKDGRTLIYVGRDFDAEPGYWEAVLAGVPPGQEREVQDLQRWAEFRFAISHAGIAPNESCGWFSVQGKDRPRKVRTLDGQGDWLENLDPKRLGIELHGRLTPKPNAEVLLASEGDALVSRLAFEESQLLLVANGSFLLNVPLVNHEHRRLAGHLIDRIGTPGKTVVFLESGPGGPPIRDDDPEPAPPSGLEISHLWPANWILLHWAIVGILFCFCRFPIFGRPRESDPEGTADFRSHLEAAGRWLARTRDRQYALSRLQSYRQAKEKSEG